MKLTTKILTGLAPVAIVGAITPTVVSCSCSGKSYSINYGDNINCYDKKRDGYKSVKSVIKAIKNKVNVESDHEKTLSLAQINADLAIDLNYQNVYFDLIASSTIITGTPVIITDWKSTVGEDGIRHYSFKYNDTEYADVVASYINQSNKAFLQFDGGKQLKVESYTYRDCKIGE